jgi:hypothetical protein
MKSVVREDFHQVTEDRFKNVRFCRRMQAEMVLATAAAAVLSQKTRLN